MANVEEIKARAMDFYQCRTNKYTIEEIRGMEVGAPEQDSKP